MRKTRNNTIGFDDGPFPPDHRGNLNLIGAVCCGTRLDGVLATRIRRDGVNSTDRIAAIAGGSRFRPQLQLILLQGIAVGGFNVVDIHALSRRLSLPVVVVARHEPNLNAIRAALLDKVPGGRRKWRLIEQAGPPVSAAGVWLQCSGIAVEHAAETVGHLAIHSTIPEPLRLAHVIAGGISGSSPRRRV